MKETNTTAWFQSLEKALGKLAAIAAVVILLIFPLYVRDFYFDILNAKYQFYYITMLAVFVIAFIIFVVHIIQDFRYEDGKNVKAMFKNFSIKKMPLSHIFASIFLIVCIISTLQSQYLYESFWGNEGRYTGLFLLYIYVLSFLFISIFLKLKKRYLNLFLIAGMLACIFGITDYFKRLYHYRGTSLDKKNIMDEFKQMRFNFSKVAKEFKLIEENTKLIYINKETRAEELLNELKIKGASKERLREAGQYCVQIYGDERTENSLFDKLYSNGMLRPISEDMQDFYELVSQKQYSDEWGLDFSVDDMLMM